MFQGFVLKGEISNFTRHRTGHLYFALKDENASIKAIMFSNYADKLNFAPKDGDKVTITGSISLYAPQGSYSVNVSKMQIDGAGELYLKYLELKEKLKNLGWFDKPKRTFPRYPKNIGVVTSPTGAVIEDITNTVNRRYRLTNIILYPALVQGPGASKSVAEQIEKANNDNICDVLIVGRGGGSMEDLWGFNELPAISAIYNSKIPVISAIGHETDDTLSDLVSDLRAPTPTAAAELATPDKFELIKYINESTNNLTYKLNNLIRGNETNLMHLIERIETSSPIKKLSNYHEKLLNSELLLKNYFSQKINMLSNNLKNIILKINNLSPQTKLTNSYKEIEQLKVIMNKNYNYIIESNQKNMINVLKELKTSYVNVVSVQSQRLNYNIDMLNKVNPLNIMKRGFTIIKNNNGNILSSVKDVNINDDLEIDFHDGRAYAKVINKGVK
ncbi:Exodeoxyribonuclease 7 large subunit [Haploplasma axanthum]|uniref:Exodeoxyribonuclease 7 large subunit n=2 Tax=Haploplasma axanthum TaxID=29552 RepID=A0A449BE74_HAPAX|nr:Exodeoxyribonuclease 7 large subunit [Haploplasma axanthum]